MVYGVKFQAASLGEIGSTISIAPTSNLPQYKNPHRNPRIPMRSKNLHETPRNPHLCLNTFFHTTNQEKLYNEVYGKKKNIFGEPHSVNISYMSRHVGILW
jgi:hypothetical protein